MKLRLAEAKLLLVGTVSVLLCACGSPYNSSYDAAKAPATFPVNAEAISRTATPSAHALEISVPAFPNLAVPEKTVAPAKAPEVAPAPLPNEPVPFANEKPELGSLSSTLALIRMPEFQSSWGLSKELYEKVAQYYNLNRQYLKNPDYVTIVDFSKRSSEKRFFIFDLRKSRVIPLHTTHGTNSDPTNQGIATVFSNTEDSLQSSLGFFLTLDSYEGLNGYSLRLRGIESSNSNAEKRGIVIHSAPYVSEDLGRAGRSWGCLALDPKISHAVINHLLGGSLLYIGK
ncbi:MAG: murein L,D-transpeptidase catalytic domain-containing protein [Bdellovibrionota bacterium]